MNKNFVILVLIVFLPFTLAIELNGARFPQNRLTIVSPWWEGETNDELAEYFSVELANQLRIPVGIKNLYEDRGNTAKLDTFLYTSVTRLKLLLYDNWIPILEGQPNLSDFVPIGCLAEIPYVLVAPKMNASKIQKNLGSVLRAKDTVIVVYYWDQYADTIIEELNVKLKQNFKIVRVDDIRGPIRELEKNSGLLILTTMSIALKVYPRDIAQPIAVFSSDPVAWLPDLPIAKDVGLDLNAVRIFALLAPKNIPSALFKDLEDVVRYVTKSDDFHRYAQSKNMIPFYLPPKETATQLQTVSINYCRKCNCPEKQCRESCMKCGQQ